MPILVVRVYEATARLLHRHYPDLFELIGPTVIVEEADGSQAVVSGGWAVIVRAHGNASAEDTMRAALRLLEAEGKRLPASEQGHAARMGHDTISLALAGVL